MFASTMDLRLGFQKLFWFCVVTVGAVAAGYGLASDSMLLVILVVGALWLTLLPYHFKLSIYISIATFSSALIVPLFPGRLYMWEASALLGWSGLVVSNGDGP